MTDELSPQDLPFGRVAICASCFQLVVKLAPKADWEHTRWMSDDHDLVTVVEADHEAWVPSSIPWIER